MWTAANQATGDWLLFTDADVLFKPDSLRRALAYAESVPADHVVLFPQMIMKRPGEFMMIAFFQTMFMFGHRPWKVADPSTDDHMGVGAFNLVRRRVYDAVGTYAALRMEVLDDMKLGKVVKQAGFAQRNVFGGDLISLRWAEGAMGIVNNLTKNFFAVLSFQWWRTVISAFGLAFLNFGPFLGIFLAHGWARAPFAVALASMFAIYIGMSWRSAVPPYYFLLHPVSTTLFIYTLLRSMFLTLWNDGIVWRGRNIRSRSCAKEWCRTAGDQWPEQGKRGTENSSLRDITRPENSELRTALSSCALQAALRKSSLAAVTHSLRRILPGRCQNKSK